MADRHETAARAFRRTHLLNVSLAVAGKTALAEACDEAEKAFASALRRVEEAERERCAKIGDKGARLGWTAQSVANEIRSIPAHREGT